MGSCFEQWCRSETPRRVWSDKHQRKLPQVAEGAEPRCAAGTEWTLVHLLLLQHTKYVLSDQLN